MKYKKPIIGIIGRPDMASDDDKVICIWEDSRRCIVKKGGVPLLILPTQDVEYESIRPKETPSLTENEKDDLKCIIDLCDGILIPGGYKWYEYDEFIYNYAMKKDMPILGICAGMQMMACVDNKLNSIFDTTAKNDTSINHHQRKVKYVHKINIENDTFLNNIIGTNQIKVNSKHNYHVQKVNNFKVSAYSEDGLIEAIEYPNKKFVLGIQWHPEAMLDYDENANKIFDRFIKECK